MFPHSITVEVGAGSQFLGTEFRATPRKRNTALRLRNLELQMGSESKTWRIEKIDKDGNVRLLLQQSADNSGSPAANTEVSVMLKGEDIETVLDPRRGEQIQITTGAATSAMRATLLLDEVPVG